jgi:hypothetical protein
MCPIPLQKPAFPWKPFAILGLLILFLVIFPVPLTEHAPKSARYAELPLSFDEKLNILIREFRKEGYTVYNYYPSYIQVEKKSTSAAPIDEANRLARIAYNTLGESVKIILVTDEGKFVGYYKGE